MTDLLILISFVPFIFMAFESLNRLRPLFGWAAVLIAVICHGYFVFTKSGDPLAWIPVAAFFSMLALEIVCSKRVRVLTLIGALFVSQALVSVDPAAALILIAFADGFFAAELFISSDWTDKSRAIQSIYRSALSLLPAAAAILLQLQGDWFVAMFAVTIAFRMFSWPMTHWVYEIDKNARTFLLYSGVVPAFALWHIQVGIDAPQWAVVWVCLAAVYSIGAKYFEVYTALALAVFSFNPTLGVAAVALWPLLVNQGRLTYLITLATGALGFFAADQIQKALVPEASYALASVAAFMIARPFVATRIEPVKVYIEALEFVIGAALAVLAFFMKPIDLVDPQNFAIDFGACFLLMFALGKLLFSKKPAFFLPARTIPPRVFKQSVISLNFLADKPGTPVIVKDGRLRASVFQALDSEAYMVLLLGILGAILLWGTR
jgi:hypothetical protein